MFAIQYERFVNIMMLIANIIVMLSMVMVARQKDFRPICCVRKKMQLFLCLNPPRVLLMDRFCRDDGDKGVHTTLSSLPLFSSIGILFFVSFEDIRLFDKGKQHVFLDRYQTRKLEPFSGI